MTGVDPAAAMLDVAKRKPHAEQVEWVESSAQSYQSHRRFDLIIMTGHVFQVLLTDADALAVLDNMRGHLKKRGRVAFETRNPSVDWAGEWAGRRHGVHMPLEGQLIETLDIIGRDGELISAIKITSRERAASNWPPSQSPSTSRSTSPERAIRASTCCRDGNRSVLLVVSVTCGRQ